MKAKEFLEEMRGATDEALRERSRALAEELMRLRLRKATGQLEASHKIREAKRGIARIETLLTARSSRSGSAGAQGK
jgi:large subunit ribosomal protein L29